MLDRTLVTPGSRVRRRSTDSDNSFSEAATTPHARVFADGAPLLVMTSGRHRVDTTALARRLGRTTLERATPEQVRLATGQAIGGVAPVGHPAPLETVVDESLAEYPRVWTAGGTPHTVFPTTFDELVRLTGASVHPVTS